MAAIELETSSVVSGIKATIKGADDRIAELGKAIAKLPKGSWSPMVDERKALMARKKELFSDLKVARERYREIFREADEEFKARKKARLISLGSAGPVTKSKVNEELTAEMLSEPWQTRGSGVPRCSRREWTRPRP